jgi:catechol 2,3-dioxygenase-like lactoylglutathione lyase family enzyme
LLPQLRIRDARACNELHEFESELISDEPMVRESGVGWLGYLPQAFTHGTLQCDDIERSRRFYTEVLGLEILAGFNNAQYIKHATAPWYIVVLKRNPRQYLAPANRFTLQMDSAAAVEQAHSELSTDGEAACITELGKLDARNGKTSFIFSDLDKNWWELTG